MSKILVSAACLFFGAALGLPVFSITPGVGDLTEWLRMIRPENMAIVEQSLLGGIQSLWIEGEHALGIILAAVCLLLPLFKFSVLWGDIYGLKLHGTVWGRLCKITAPYAMVEVFVVGIIVVAIKGLPGGTKIEVHSGTWCFTASVILSLLAAKLLERDFESNSSTSR